MHTMVGSPFSWLSRSLLVGALASGLLGCHETSSTPADADKPKQAAHPVRVIVVDDPPLAAALTREWKARMETELQLQEMTVEQLESARQLIGDVVIYPSACLGTIAQRDLIAEPTTSAYEDEQYAQRDVFELQRNAEVRWGQQPMAFSFGSPQLVLAYRADLFRKLQLLPPATWPDYQQCAIRLTAAELGELAPAQGKSWSAVCEPLSTGWAGTVLLARAASYASHPSQFSVAFDYVTMEPLIAGPPFVRALEELVAATQLGPVDADKMSPEDARRLILGGHVAMAFCWLSHSTSTGEPFPLADGVEMGFAPLPGADTAYNVGEKLWTSSDSDRPVQVPLLAVAGRLGSVVKNARRPREAADLLALLTGKEWSERLSPESTATTLFRQSQTRKSQVWTDPALPVEASDQYAKVVSATQSLPIHLFALRIPGRQRYLAALDQAVVAARAGEKSPADALTEAAAAWSAITQELGIESQREAYTRSLGLEP